MLRLSSLLRAASSAPLRQGNARVLSALAPASSHVGHADAAPKHKSKHHLSRTTFASLDISESSKRAIVEDFKYEHLTHVQNETIAHIMAGKDVLSKAKTGNGKTMAFLIPTIEHLVRRGKTAGSIPALVISPTRELAQQIATEARRLTKHHKVHVACFVGGTSINKDLKELSEPLDILIATPGRLLDHITQDKGRIKAKLGKLRFLILDEADRLLDMGFRNELLKILSHIPTERQTLLFSATLPTSTKELQKVALRDDYVLVDTVSEDEDQTNVQAVQTYLTCPSSDVVAMVEHVVSAHMVEKPDDYKVMVFFPTARAAQYMAHLFAAAGFKGVLEMHSRKSQTARTKTADAFRVGKRVIMFSSDVSARGVDYPDVSLVLQVGLTDRDQYIHRLGRTARAGSDGQGVLVLADFEKSLLKDLKDLPLTKGKFPEGFNAEETRTAKAIASLKKGSELEKSAQQSYQAWLGFYNSNLKRLGLSREELVEMATEYSEFIGLAEVPKLDKKILKKMNLLGVEGVEAAAFDDSRQNRGSKFAPRDGNRPRRGGSDNSSAIRPRATSEDSGRDPPPPRGRERSSSESGPSDSVPFSDRREQRSRGRSGDVGDRPRRNGDERSNRFGSDFRGGRGGRGGGRGDRGDASPRRFDRRESSVPSLDGQRSRYSGRDERGEGQGRSDRPRSFGGEGGWGGRGGFGAESRRDGGGRGRGRDFESGRARSSDRGGRGARDSYGSRSSGGRGDSRPRKDDRRGSDSRSTRYER